MILWNVKKEKNIHLKWTDYLWISLFTLVVGIGIIFLIYPFAQESEYGAVMRSSLIVGFSAIVILGIVVQLVRRRNSA
ncbi:reductive dehalogenase membrane anchor [Dehalococcoides mccartyi]|nr:reductive dehalogenase membrane anchor [Dehalococcoides mccartyi]